MKLYTLAVIIAVLTVGIKCQESTQIKEARLEVARSINSFSTSLYTVLSEEPGNLVVSPWSVDAVLAMLLVGLRGKTAHQVSTVLQLPDSRSQVEQGFKSLIESLQGSGNVTLEVANKIYIQDGFKIKDEFRQSIAKNFKSEVEQVDFIRRTESVRNAINEWAELKTNHKIKDLLPKGTLRSDTVMMLLNAIYFKGLWHSKFQTNRTTEEIFHLRSQETSKVQMMNQKDHFRFRKFDNLEAQVLRLPYQGERISMLVFLPNEVSGVTNLERNMKDLNMTNILDNLRWREVIVSLPRFKIESSLKLVEPLSKLGLSDIFRPGGDFSGITDENILINTVIQKAYIEVNEEGTEAAAVSGGGAIPVSLPPPPKIFKADHPFMFTIVDEMSKVILFMGRVDKP